MFFATAVTFREAAASLALNLILITDELLRDK